jgi:hypothetical protein
MIQTRPVAARALEYDHAEWPGSCKPTVAVRMKLRRAAADAFPGRVFRVSHGCWRTGEKGGS